MKTKTKKKLYNELFSKVAYHLSADLCTKMTVI